MMDIILFLVGIWYIVFAFIMNTGNILSSILFKVVPFLTGVFVAYYAAKGQGWV